MTSSCISLDKCWPRSLTVCDLLSMLSKFISYIPWFYSGVLTHWGRVTHICVSDLTSSGSDNGLPPGRRQAIIRTNAGILLIRPLGTNFIEFLVEILITSFKKIRLRVSSAKRRPFCLGLNELNLPMLKAEYSGNIWYCRWHTPFRRQLTSSHCID